MRRFIDRFVLLSLALGFWMQPGCTLSQFGDSKQLPELPDLNLESFVPATREKLEKAYQAARAEPENANAVGNLGMLLQAHQQFGLAEPCYERARLLEPDSFRWRYYLGITQFRQGKRTQAAETFLAARDLRPDYAPLQLRLGEALFALERLEQSHENYKAVLQRDAGSAEAHYGLGRVLAAQGDPSAAVSQLEKACELAPNFGAAHYELALVYRDLGETENSSRQLQLYEKHKTGAPPTNDTLIAAVNALKDTALEHLNAGVKLKAAGEIEASIREHERALEIDPKLVQAHINLLILYGELGKIKEATEHYRAASQLNPNQAELHYNYGVLAYDHGQLQEARKAFERALDINPNYARAHNNLGQMFELDGRFDEALDHYRKAIENRPNYRLAHFHRGRILLMKHRTREAIEAFQHTLEPEDEKTPSFLYALAAAYVRAGDRNKAIQYGRRALRLARTHQQSELAVKIAADLKKLNPGGALEP